MRMFERGLISSMSGRPMTAMWLQHRVSPEEEYWATRNARRILGYRDSDDTVDFYGRTCWTKLSDLVERPNGRHRKPGMVGLYRPRGEIPLAWLNQRGFMSFDPNQAHRALRAIDEELRELDAKW